MSNFLIQGAFVSTGDPTTVNESSLTVFAPGQLGKVFTTSNQTLFNVGSSPRIYQFVLRSATDVAAAAGGPGAVAFWKSYDNYVVTTDASDSYDGSGQNHVAGVFPGTNALASGNYGFIQVGGQGPVLFQGAPTNTPTTAGLPVVAVATQDLQANSTTSWITPTVNIWAKTLTVVNSGSIGANTAECLLFPTRVGW